MKRAINRFIAVGVALVMVTLAVSNEALTSTYADSNGSDDGTQRVTILFTHDMHSHEEKAGKIKTVYDEELANNESAFLIDAGDFSMGTPYQTIFTVEASELRVMGAVGFDVTTLGNHEFDVRSAGLAKMLNAAAASGDRLPEIVNSNIDWDSTLEDEDLRENGENLKSALEAVNSKEYTVIEKDGVRIAFFGIFGKESASYAPESGTIFLDPVETAQSVVDKIEENEDVDLIVCLSHSGTNASDPDSSEDEILAQSVEGIDIIISGHSHTYLSEPIVYGDTYIVSCGQYNDNIGKISGKFDETGEFYIEEYELVPLDDSIADDPEISALTDEFWEKANEEYFSDYGLRLDDVLTTNSVEFTPIDEFASEQGEDTLGNLISDSYIYGVMQAEGDDYETVDVAVAPAGVIRGSFDIGDITTADAYNVLSIGTGADGRAGYPLVSVYLSGEELKLVAEVDITVSELMGPARLYNSGLSYDYNMSRMILNRAYNIRLDRGDGNYEEIEDDKLYRVVADLYSAQMLGTVNSMSKGLLSLVPKDKDGNPIEDYEAQIIYDENGMELKEWYALASYLKSFGGEGVPSYYETTDNRKVEFTDKSPSAVLQDTNKYFWAICGIGAGAVAIIVVAGVLIHRKVKNRKQNR